MAFDTQTRNRLNNFVADARELLTEEFTNQFQVDYGLDPDTGEISDMDRLTHLDDARKSTALVLRETIQHYYANLPTKNKKPENDYKTLIERVIREQAFTVLNRLCAVRMAEARELVIEAIGQGTQSQGFQLYGHVIGSSLGETGAAYQQYLFSVFDEFAFDLPVLFDRYSPQGRLFPRETVLKELIEHINHPEINHLWAEDETIGWIYQYFNSKEERKAMRDASQAPRNSRELAVRNQFFTPRYVVEFLTDNTLGRIWYEMRQGQTSLSDECQYLVRRPDEIFLAESTKKGRNHAEDGVLLAAKQLAEADEKDFPPYSAENDDEIQRMIDLAHCVSAYKHGTTPSNWEPSERIRTGSFDNQTTLQLLAELFMTCRNDRHGGDGSVYLERWFADACNEVRRRVLKARDTDLSQEELLNQPVVIPYRPLKDPRDIRMLDPACGSMHFGLYAFDLYLRIYEEYWDHCGEDSFRKPDTEHVLPTEEYADKAAWLKAAPKLIIENNIHGIDIDPRAVQIAGLSLWLRAQRAWKSQGIAAGDRPQVTRSNIVCAEPMPGDQQQLAAFCQELHPAIAQMVTAIFEEMKLAGEAGSLLKIEQEITALVAKAHEQWRKEPKERQLELFGGAEVVKEEQLEFDLSGITDQQFFEQAEETIYEALRKYASETSEGGFRRKLFAGDAEKGFAFVELCRKQYEAVLMNPPFGEASIPSRKHLYKSVASSSQDLFAAFVARCSEMLRTSGMLGAISNRLALIKDLLEEWRTEVFLGGACRLQVVGDLGYGVLDGAVVEAAAYVTMKASAEPSGVDTCLFVNALDTLEKEPALLAGVQSACHGRESARLTEHRLDSFDALPGRSIAYWCSVGWFERLKEWPRASEIDVIAKKGLETGDDFRHLRLLWEVPEDAIVPFERWTPFSKGGPYRPTHCDLHLAFDWSKRDLARRTSNSELYGKPGLTFTERTTSNFAARVLPSQSLFSPAGPAIVREGEDSPWGLLGLVNSSVAAFYIELFVGGGDTSVPGTAARHLSPHIVEDLPVPPSNSKMFAEVAPCVKSQHAALNKFRFQEPSNYFSGMKVGDARIRASAEMEFNDYERSVVEALSQYKQIDEIVFREYEVSAGERNEAMTYLGRTDFETENDEDVIEDVITKIFSDTPVDDVATEMLNDDSKLRSLTKLSHAVDMRYEAAARLLGMTPGEVASRRQHLKVTPPSVYAQHASDLVSFIVGCAFGRWDLQQIATSFTLRDEEVFEKLPIHPIAQLCDSRGAVATKLDVDETYPVSLPWDGILADDESSHFNLASQLLSVTQEMWKGVSDEAERELSSLLGVDVLHDYIKDTNRFFDDHLSRYSNSRRSAPIYWPISTESGSYTLWFYYHRLTDQTLYKAVNDFVDPKLKQTLRQLADLRAIKDRSSSQEKELAQLTELESELEQFKADLLEIAAFWKPNLNDGVQITAAPLWKFFRLTKWRNKLKKTWSELESGKYDWAHLALSIWPDRVVREKCTTDRSIAIAHDLEESLWHEVEVTTVSRSGRETTKLEWQPKDLTVAELDAIVAEVKAR